MLANFSVNTVVLARTTNVLVKFLSVVTCVALKVTILLFLYNYNKNVVLLIGVSHFELGQAHKFFFTSPKIKSILSRRRRKFIKEIE